MASSFEIFSSSCSSHVSLEDLLSTLDDVAIGTDALSVHEAFGPLSILVETPAGTDLAALMPEKKGAEGAAPEKK